MGGLALRRALMTAAIFMRFGRAPTTQSMGAAATRDGISSLLTDRPTPRLAPVPAFPTVIKRSRVAHGCRSFRGRHQRGTGTSGNLHTTWGSSLLGPEAIFSRVRRKVNDGNDISATFRVG